MKFTAIGIFDLSFFFHLYTIGRMAAQSKSDNLKDNIKVGRKYIQN